MISFLTMPVGRRRLSLILGHPHLGAVVAGVVRYSLPISLAICVCYFVVGFWPFNFRPQNRVSWLADGNGIHFEPHSIVHSQGPIDPGRASSPSAPAGSISIELWLQPQREEGGNIFPILSLYDGQLPENLLIAQWRSSLLLRVPVWDAKGQRKYREVGIAALSRRKPRLITMTSGPAGTFFYANGAQVKALPKLLLRPQILKGELILGNSPAGRGGWSGNLFGLALYGLQLTGPDVLRHYEIWTARRASEIAPEPGLFALYFFDQCRGNTVSDRSGGGHTLVIPQTYRVTNKPVLELPRWESHPSLSDIEDIVVNLLGFVPFGFFFFIHRDAVRPARMFRNAAFTVVASGLISLAIELIQVYLPGRSSSLSDLMCNIGGGLAGAFLAALCILVGSKFRERRM